VREVRKRLIATGQADAGGARLDPPRLTLTVDLAGPEMAGAYRYGHIQVQARDNLGGEIKLLPSGGADTQPADGFVDIDPNLMFSWEQKLPQNRLRVDLGFAPPPRNATHLALVEGSILVQRAGAQEQATFERILERHGQTLQHAVLEKAGITLMVGIDGDQRVSLDVTGPLEALSRIELLAADGQPLGTGRAWTLHEDHATLKLQAWQIPPPGTALRLSVASDHETVIVPFKFGNIALP
jgi:hypothetical protein